MTFLVRHVWRQINPRKIVFSNFKGRGYGCNPKYIAEELLRRNCGLDIVWLCGRRFRRGKCFPPGVRPVPYGSWRAIYEQATAGVWVDNQRKQHFIRRGLVKKPGQVYIQTFHGAIGIKKCGADMWRPELGADRRRLTQADAGMIDYLLSNSNYETEMYRTSFFGKGQVLLVGHPRNDVFFGGTAARLRESTRAKLGIPDGVRVVLYAPTYRENPRVECFDLDYAAVLAALADRFGGRWRFLVRYHPSMKLRDEVRPSPACAIDATDYPDIQELLVTADAMITDYSSCIFDFMLSGRPGFIFAKDLEQQNAERGFYYPIETTPFPIGRDSASLCERIRRFDAEAYAAAVPAFLKDKGCMEDGHASERVADLIERVVGRA